MFNESIKKKYMNQYAKKMHVWALKIVFDKSEPYEEDQQKDFCQLGQEVVYEILRQCSEKKSGMYTCIAAAYSYLDWCKEYGYTTVNWLDGQYSISGLVYRIGISDDMFIDQEKFQKIMELLERSNNPVLYQALAAAIYYGLDDGDALSLDNLRVFQIFDDYVRLDNGKTFQVPGQVADILREASKVYTVVSDPDTKVYKLKEAMEGQVFKRLWGTSHPNRRFPMWISRIADACNMEITAIRLRNSGMITRISQHAQELGEHIYEDAMCAGETTYRGDNKELVYNRIFNDLSLTLTWPQFCDEYGLWIKFIDSHRS